ncbi:MAG: hypothetical protein DDT30_00140 [Dehalococcoidia bacterium]|nr:hypothetical protein [Bacillota bacterium]MBT9141658.1 hypothetical protein [Bacillota bacterium]
MKVKVKVIGALRQSVRRPQTQWDLPGGSTIEQLMNLLEFPEKIRKGPIMMLVNAKFAEGNALLKDGDELTLLWPVGGG